jgi:hypothetical protein
MRQSGHPEYAKLLQAMKLATKLRRLAITVTLKTELIDILNKNIGKDASFRSLQITFVNP